MIFGLVLIIEGLVPLLFPKQWRSYVQKLAQEPVHQIRMVGGALFCLGAVLLLLK